MISSRIQSVKMDRAGRRFAKAEQGLDEGRFPRAVGTEERHDLAVADVQRHVVHGAQLAEGDVEMIDGDGEAHV